MMFLCLSNMDLDESDGKCWFGVNGTWFNIEPQEFEMSMVKKSSWFYFGFNSRRS